MSSQINLISDLQSRVVIIGDACHPTLPYQAQGAAMAVEDGVVLGNLLGRLAEDFSQETAQAKVPTILELFEILRKKRTTLNVKGALANRHLFHMQDGEEQRQRDHDLRNYDGVSMSPWQWVDPAYQGQLLGFDVVEDSNTKYEGWKKSFCG
jgi:salicylate hydroxylase